MADNREQIYIRPRRGTRSTMYETSKSAMVLKEGELFIEVPDEGVGKGPSKVKIGDGVSAYAALPYALGDIDTVEFVEERSNDAQLLINQVVSGAKLSKIIANTKRVMQLLLDKFAGYLPITGGTVTGNVTVNGNITSQNDTSRTVSVKTDSIGVTTLKTKSTQTDNIEVILPDRAGTLALADDVPTASDTYDPTSSDAMSGKAINQALGTLDVTGASGITANKTIKAWSETDGKVSITTQNISITKSQISDFPALASVATSGNYSDLNGKPSLSTVATSGSYNDLSGTPTIGTATITIQKNGSNVNSFSVNATSNKTINIPVPTALSDLTADSTHRLVTDTEKSTWNGKQNKLTAGSGVSINNSTNVISATGDHKVHVELENTTASSGYPYAIMFSDISAPDAPYDIPLKHSSYFRYDPGHYKLTILYSDYTESGISFGSSHGGGGYKNVYDTETVAIYANNNNSQYLCYGIQLVGSSNSWALAPVTPNSANNTRLGTPTYKWNQIYSVNGAIDTSDRNLKEDILELDSTIKDFIMDLKPVSYRFKNINEGDNHDRTHYGLIAQDVEETMNKMGMTALDFAGFCKDQKTIKVNTTVNVLNEETGEIEEKATIEDQTIEGEYIYGLRYGEFISPLIKMVQDQQREIESLKARLDELENR